MFESRVVQDFKKSDKLVRCLLFSTVFVLAVGAASARPAPNPSADTKLVTRMYDTQSLPGAHG